MRTVSGSRATLPVRVTLTYASTTVSCDAEARTSRTLQVRETCSAFSVIGIICMKGFRMIE